MKYLSIVLTLIISCSVSAQSLEQQIQQVDKDVIKWRRHLHQNPELSNREFETAKYIAKNLKSFGIEVHTGIAHTGVVGVLKGDIPGPVLGLRADIDALPVKERADVPFKSVATGEYRGQEVPVMHACGHDTHVAILLGTAKVLSQMKKDIKGTIVFVFQPAEEGAPDGEEGGAELMIKEGLFDKFKIEAMFGLHINSQTEVGKIKYKTGATMASSDWFAIKIKGKQTHGSRPWGGIDPIAVSANIIQGLQQIVSRQSDLTKAPVVITVGIMKGGVRENIISEEAEIRGTIRTLDPKMQPEVHERIRTTATKIAEASGATVDVHIQTNTLVTYNDEKLTKKILPSLEKAAGKENVMETTWTTGAEDFSYYAAKVPSVFFFLGGMPAGMDPKDAAPHHTPDFYLDDSQLSVGVKAFCNIVLDY